MVKVGNLMRLGVGCGNFSILYHRGFLMGVHFGYAKNN